MTQSKFMKIYILPLIFLSPILAISCNSWFSIWMMMELNLMTFIPLIIFYNKYSKEISFKYFIIQSISSMTLIMSANSLMINTNKFFNWVNFFMNFSLLMKLGMPPFHQWFINIMSNMTWINCLILSTWQKIIPMILLMFSFNKKLFFIIIIYAASLSAILGLNHSSLRIIFSYSSINHMSWMLMNLMMSEMMWVMYFLMYSIMNFSIMNIFNKFNIYYINQFKILDNSKLIKFIIFFNFMSISGMPPLFGFSMKWMSIYFFSLNNLFMMNVLIIILSILTFFFYTRIMISFMMLHSINNKIFLSTKFKSSNSLNFYLILSFFNLWVMSIMLF